MACWHHAVAAAAAIAFAPVVALLLSASSHGGCSNGCDSLSTAISERGLPGARVRAAGPPQPTSRDGRSPRHTVRAEWPRRAEAAVRRARRAHRLLAPPSAVRRGVAMGKAAPRRRALYLGSGRRLGGKRRCLPAVADASSKRKKQAGGEGCPAVRHRSGERLPPRRAGPNRAPRMKDTSSASSRHAEFSHQANTDRCPARQQRNCPGASAAAPRLHRTHAAAAAAIAQEHIRDARKRKAHTQRCRAPSS
eukprot:353849-Chlamydomonas_euryale.AAC.6